MLELVGGIGGRLVRRCCGHPVRSSQEQNIAGPIKENENLLWSEQCGNMEATRAQCLRECDHGDCCQEKENE